jgi:hypothetical protein
MIPKIIHYCWFGYAPKPKIAEYCMATWKEYLPDYHIMEWNEENFDCNTNPFVKEAYLQKKWAFVSDYVRAHALYKFGGIYLDTDVEIKQNLNLFLKHGAFSGFEKKGFPFTALWGCQKGHLWAERVLHYYDELTGYQQKTNTLVVTDLLIADFKADPFKDEIQFLSHDIVLYPSSYFCLDLERNFATHHFNGSWIGDEIRFKKQLHKEYYRKQYSENVGNRDLLEDMYNSGLINSTELFRFVYKVFFKKIKNKIFTKK